MAKLMTREDVEATFDLGEFTAEAVLACYGPDEHWITGLVVTKFAEDGSVAQEINGVDRGLESLSDAEQELLGRVIDRFVERRFGI